MTTIVGEALFFLALPSSELSSGQELKLSSASLSPSLFHRRLPITLCASFSSLKLELSGFTARIVFRSVL